MKTVSIAASKKIVSLPTKFRGDVVLLLMLLFAAVPPLRAQGHYKIQLLNPPGSTYSFAFGLNNNGVVVGSFVNASAAYEGLRRRHARGVAELADR